MSKLLRVLIIENSEQKAQGFAHVLARNDYQITHQRVETQDALWAALSGEPWDLVLCALGIPGLDAQLTQVAMRECGLRVPFAMVPGADENTVDHAKADILPTAIARELRWPLASVISSLELASRSADEFATHAKPASQIIELQTLLARTRQAVERVLGIVCEQEPTTPARAALAPDLLSEHEQSVWPEVSTAPSAPVRRGRILVVDDEPMMVKVIQRTLSLEHDVAATISATEALRWITSGQRFDVILCDLMMPRMTGMELHAELVSKAPDQAERMVFLTGGAFTPRMKAFLERIDNVCLDKPFESAALRALIHSRLDARNED